jgi:hypothetical protein
MADVQGKENVEGGSGISARAEKVLYLVLTYVGSFGWLIVSGRPNLEGEADIIFSHKSRKDEDLRTNARMAWKGDKLYARALGEMLFRFARLDGTGLLTKYLNYYNSASFQERMFEYLGLNTLIVASKEHEAMYPERSAHSKSSVLEAPICYIFEMVDEAAAISFVRNLLADFAGRDSFFPHRIGDEIPSEKLGNQWGLLGEMVKKAVDEAGTVKYTLLPGGNKCSVTVCGLTKQVVEATLPFDSTMTRKAAQEALALQLLPMEDLKRFAVRVEDCEG